MQLVTVGSVELVQELLSKGPKNCSIKDPSYAVFDLVRLPLHSNSGLDLHWK